MTDLRSRFEVAAGAFIVAGGLFGMGLCVYGSWIGFLSYFRYSGRDPDGLGCAPFDIFVIVVFVWTNTFPYRVVRLLVTSFLEVAKARRSTQSIVHYRRAIK